MTTSTKFFLGGLVLVAAVGGGVMVAGQKSAPITAGSTTLATPAVATSLAPDLTLTTAKSAQAELIASTSAVFADDTLTTSHNGRGLLEGSNGTVTVLDYDTKFTLVENDSAGTHVSGFLGSGALWAKVEKVFGAGEHYTVKTQNAVAVVRGTSLGVSYRGGVTTLTVATGTVAFMPTDAAGNALEDKMVLVKGGNKGVIDASGQPRVSALTTDDTDASWYLFNNSANNTQKGAPQTPVDTTTTKTPPTTPVKTSTDTTAPKKTAPTPSGAVAADTAPAGDSCGSFSDTGSQGGSSLKLSSVSPKSVSQSGAVTVTLTGTGFNCVTDITLGGKDLSGETDFVVVNNSSITVSSSLLPIGTFDISMMDTLGKIATLAQAITVTR